MASKIPSPNKRTGKAAKKPSRAASSVTTPRKSAAKKHIAPTRTPVKKAKSSKRDASKYILLPDERVTVQSAAKKHYKREVVNHLIDVAVGSDSAMMTSQLADVPYSQTRELLAQPDVQTAIAGRRMTLAAECGITSQKVMSQFAAMGFSSMKRYGRLLMADSVVAELAEMSDDDAAAIQELTTEMYWDEQAEKEVKRVKIKLYPKGAALEKMAQHLGIKGFGGPLAKAGIDRVGVQTVVAPDGTVTTTAIVQQLSDEQIEDMLLGVDDDDDVYTERVD
jgi:hypothetical protein